MRRARAVASRIGVRPGGLLLSASVALALFVSAVLVAVLPVSSTRAALPVGMGEAYTVAVNGTLIANDADGTATPGNTNNDGILANDSDPDEHPLLLTVLSGPSFGTLTDGANADGTFIYQPNTDFSGPDALIYELRDQPGGDPVGPFAAAITVEAAATLTITPTPISFPNLVLTGVNQGYNAFPNPWRVDASGTTGGWHLTLSGSSFSDGAGHTITTFRVRLGATKIVVISGDPIGPSTTQPTFQTFAGPTQIASAAVGEGNGVYDLTPEFRVRLLANTFAGSYLATVTVDLTAGP